MTHAIQDWSDVHQMVKFVEADAYIAQAVAFGSDQKKLTAAAKIVIAGKAVGNDKAWVAAYTEIANAVAANKDYAVRAEAPSDDYLEKGTEAIDLKAAMDKLEAAARNAKPAKK